MVTQNRAEMTERGLLIPRELLTTLPPETAGNAPTRSAAKPPRELLTRRKTQFALTTLFAADGTAQDGVSISSYGQGQVTGGMFTVPAHGEITVDFKLKLPCVTPVTFPTELTLPRIGQ
jgi:hypothetical protein